MRGLNLLMARGALSGHTDDFSSNTLSSYTEYADAAGGWSIGSGVISCNTPLLTYKQSCLTRNGVSFADGTVSCIITAADDAGMVLRLADNNNYYLVAISDASGGNGATNVVRIWRRVGGTFTGLTSGIPISFTRGTPHTLSFTATGSTLSVKFDGTTIGTVTDSAISASGKCGIRHDSGITTIDSFTWP